MVCTEICRFKAVGLQIEHQRVYLVDFPHVSPFDPGVRRRLEPY